VRGSRGQGTDLAAWHDRVWRPIRYDDGVRQVGELTGLAAFRGPDSHAAPCGCGKSLEIVTATYGK